MFGAARRLTVTRRPLLRAFLFEKIESRLCGSQTTSTDDPHFMVHTFRQRSLPALRAALIHLMLSFACAGIVALLVFNTWFPPPFREMLGGSRLFWLIAGVDIVCGPLLTLIVFNPAKPRSELRRDLALIGMIQVLALAYGVHTLSYARPVAVVHEVDRFRVVSFADLEEADAANAPAWARPWSLSPVRTIGTRAATNSEEKFASVDASLQGVEPSQRPSWWQDYSLSATRVLERSQPLAALRAKHAAKAAEVDAAVAQAATDQQNDETRDAATLRWAPLVSRRATDWVVLIDPVTARIRGYVHLDGF